LSDTPEEATSSSRKKRRKKTTSSGSKKKRKRDADGVLEGYFGDDGRDHHTREPPVRSDDQKAIFGDEKIQTTYDNINEWIDKKKELRDQLKKRKMGRKSIPCKELLSEGKPLYNFMHAKTVKNVEALDALVEEAVDGGECLCKNPKHTLNDFYSVRNLKEKQGANKPFRIAKGLAAQRMILHYGLHCYYCLEPVTPDHADKYWGWTFEHLISLGKKLKDVSTMVGDGADTQIKEMKKCVPCCMLCNPRGDKTREFHVDRTYVCQLPVDESEMEGYKHVREIVTSSRFERFTKECIDLGLDRTRFRRNTPCFVGMKHVLWKHYPGFLLEDTVTFREIDDYFSPRYSFRRLVWNLVLRLSNQCYGSNLGDCTSPFRNLRNLAPHQLGGIHYDHSDGMGRVSKADGEGLTSLLNCKWETFLEKLQNCVVKCAECHKGD
jgi:hypothetical protein